MINEEDAAVTIGVKGEQTEDEIGRRRKRGRRGHEAQEEWGEEMTVGINKEEGDVSTVMVKAERGMS